ncbi:EAL domain-containing protein [Synechococcus sp. RSCCF101]|uniref:sensor domain-containing protein n=1 Tax=Synechococcus sp. RSCCF101 TaxID=2511069 RepID=UPI001248C7C9|nr:EAL domain-containing protein [Synechococcus sp. RSCCF101]QEY31222.1 EAL domain-containing protein [Synechococcus sp. RSCCF101]
MNANQPSGKSEGVDRNRFREIVDGIPAAVFQYRRYASGHDSVSYTNKGCEDLSEIPADQVSSDATPLWDLVVQDDVIGLYRSIKTSARELTFWKHEWRIKTPSGRLKWLNGTGTPTRQENGDTIWDSVIIDVTSERQSQLRMDGFFNQQMSLNIIADGNWKILRANEAWSDHHKPKGTSRLTGASLINLVHDEDKEQFNRLRENRLESPEGQPCQFRLLLDGDSYVYLNASVAYSETEELFYMVAQDVTELKQSHERLRRASTVFNRTSEGILITSPDGEIREVNDSFLQITGYKREEIIGQNPRVLKSGRHSTSFYQDLWRSVREHGSWSGEIWNRRKDGTVYPQLLSINAVTDDKGMTEEYIGICADVSNVKRDKEMLEFLAHHDPLTGLPNRLLFDSRLSLSMQLAARNQTQLAVAFLDLDHFKNINDTLGHAAGDELLLQISKRLGSSVRSSDCVARISGDEFVILLTETKGPENVSQIIQMIRGIFEKPFVLPGLETHVTASIGVALYPDDGNTSSELLANADAAMYHAKENGRNNYLFYSPAFTERAYEHLFLESAIRDAIAERQFFLAYQPQVSLSSGKTTGLEALLRWRHPKKGIITPTRFIPVAEQTGLIRPLGVLVLKMACTQAKAWIDAGVPIGRIAVNVAAQQFHHHDFVSDVREALNESGLQPDRLELELTERFVMHLDETSVAQLKALRALGIMISIDDFGTGYSSLIYLKTLPVDKIKVDQSFVRDIPEDRDDVAIADAVIALGSALDLLVIAEGVETTEQLAHLKGRSCAQGQGYFFSRPLKAEAVPGFLSRQD